MSNSTNGSELDAEVARWNLQQVLDAKAMPYSSYLKNMKVVDKYTLVMELNDYSNQLVPSWGWWSAMYSKAAWEKASGGDLEKGKEWARTHTSTGPFMLKDFKRDVSMTWVKNPNYWRKGRPYLDGIEVRYIPESMTASAMMQAKEADMWEADAKNQVDLVKKGFKRQASWPALGYAIWPNTANPSSKWKDKRLREAIEYALEEDAIAKALGFGLYKPLKSCRPKASGATSPTITPVRTPLPRQRNSSLQPAMRMDSKPSSSFSLPPTGSAGTAIKQYLDARLSSTWTSPTRGGSSAPSTTRPPARISTCHSGSPAGTRINL